MSRSLSLLIAVAYLVIGLIVGRPTSPREVLAFVFLAVVLLFPLACIWFGDELGNYMGALPGPAINRQTPGWMIRIAGWVLLLMPVIVFLFFSPNL